MLRSAILIICCFILVSTSLTEDVDSIQSPATVRIHHERSSESELHVSVEAFGERHDLKMKKIHIPYVDADEVTLDNEGELDLKPGKRSEEKDTDFYEDESNNAVLYMTGDNALEGVIAEGKSLKFDGKSYTATKHKASSFESIVGPEIVTNSSNINITVAHPAATSRSIHHYYVEVIAMLDYTMYRALGRNWRRMRDYTRVYWYLVYRKFLTAGAVRVIPRLLRVLYSTSPAYDRYLMDARSIATADIKISMRNFCRYMSRYRGYNDVGHLLTKRDLYSRNGSKVDKRHTGMVPTIFGVCSVGASDARNTAVSEDDANFKGVLTTARLLAFNLGAYRDGHGNARACRASDGYIMGNYKLTVRSQWFSPCSAQAFLNAPYSPRGSCLRRLSSSYFSLLNIKPGYRQTIDQQCRFRTRRANAKAHASYKYSPYQCTRLVCSYISGRRTYSYVSRYSALEGTACGFKWRGRCFHGFCRFRSG